MSEMDASVCFGAVMHERRALISNRFVYPFVFLRLPLERLGQIRVRGLGIERAAVFSFRAADHGPRTGAPLLPWIRARLNEAGLSQVCNGEVVLQTMPRILGYVFNPVSFWFCYDGEKRLRAVLAEVNNTFGEHHNYLLHHSDLRAIERDDVLKARKIFHVSPFFDCEGEYRFRFGERDGVHYAVIDYHDAEGVRLATRVGGRAEALTAAALRKWIFRFPFMTLGVIARIHWQALRLWLGRVPFHRKPAPPQEEISR